MILYSGKASRSNHSVFDVWNYATRTLTSFGDLISSIWANITRTLTLGTKDTEIDAIKNQTDKISSIKTETDKIAEILGLSQSNYRIISFTYEGQLLKESIMKIYGNKSDCEANIDSTGIYKMTATYNVDGKCTGYKVTKEA